MLLKEIFAGIDLTLLKNEYRYYNLGGKAVYIENFVRINTFCKEEVILKLKKGMIKVSGADLFLEELKEDCVLIKGTIKGVDVY